MGDYIHNLFQQVKSKHGEINLYRLVIKTKVTMEMAQEMEENDENKLKIENAIKELGLEVDAVEKISRRKSLLRRIFGR